MIWDYAEGNPFSLSTGNWNAHTTWIAKSLLGFPSLGSSIAEQADAQATFRDALHPPSPRKSTLSHDSLPSRLALSTDPPYYDNIGYADLIRFLLRLDAPQPARRLSRYFRHDARSQDRRADRLPRTATRPKPMPKNTLRWGMRGAFANFRRFVRHDFPLTVYYAFKQQDAGFMSASLHRHGGTEGGQVASTGWETMLTSLVSAGFSITGTWPMRTERSARSNAIKTNALASSIVLVCRPRPADAPATSRRRFLATASRCATARSSASRPPPPSCRPPPAPCASTDSARAGCSTSASRRERPRPHLPPAR